jgi:hypothetical protein
MNFGINKNFRNENKSGKFCRECGRCKFFQRFCLWCFKNTNSDIRVAISETITVRESGKIRKYKLGIKKFIVEVLFGWSPTKGRLVKKLNHGVERSRVIDREKDEYHEIIKDYKTKKIVHKCHEPLSKHKK